MEDRELIQPNLIVNLSTVMTYIYACESNCKCSSIRVQKNYTDRGIDAKVSPLYMQVGTVYLRKEENGYSWPPDFQYQHCTGCHKPATAEEAERLNTYLGIPLPEIDYDYLGF